MLPGMSLFGGGHADCYIEFHFGVKNEENFEIRFFGLFLTSIGCQYGPVWMCSETQNGKFGEKQKPENSFPRPLFFHRFPFRGFLEKKPKIKAGRPAGQPAGRRWRPPLGPAGVQDSKSDFSDFFGLRIQDYFANCFPEANGEYQKGYMFLLSETPPRITQHADYYIQFRFFKVFQKLWESSGRALGELWESSFSDFFGLRIQYYFANCFPGANGEYQKSYFFCSGRRHPGSSSMWTTIYESIF